MDAMIGILTETTWAASAAIVLVLLLRLPLRRGFGMRVAYASWLLVPAAMLAVLLPARQLAVAPVDAATGFFMSGQAGFERMATTSVAASTWWPEALLGAWLLGACVVIAGAMVAQRRFVASLGEQRRRADGLYETLLPHPGLPAVVGLGARIVLPADFETRYDAAQRRLILLHEQAHVARMDPWVNAAVLMLLALHWFNPLAWLAAHRIRRDQELACDALVVAACPQERHRYGAVLLQVNLSTQPAPLACHWSDRHSIKERLMGLKEPIRNRRLLQLGMSGVLGATALTGFAAWAMQPAQVGHPQAGSTYRIEVVQGDEPMVKLDATRRTMREAALEVARQAGWRIADPNVLDNREKSQGELLELPANVALTTITQRMVKVEGTTVVFAGKLQPDTLPRGAESVAGRSVTISVQQVPLLQAAEQIVEQAGLQLGNPEALEAGKPVTFSFHGVPVTTILGLVAEEAGREVEFRGNTAFFVEKAG